MNSFLNTYIARDKFLFVNGAQFKMGVNMLQRKGFSHKRAVKKAKQNLWRILKNNS